MSTAETFATRVLQSLQVQAPLAEHLDVRKRGKTATIGLEDQGEWVPLIRLANGSASFNVMSLEVRSHGRWEPTGVRGVPKDVAAALATTLRFLWEFEVNACIDAV